MSRSRETIVRWKSTLLGEVIWFEMSRLRSPKRAEKSRRSQSEPTPTPPFPLKFVALLPRSVPSNSSCAVSTMT